MADEPLLLGIDEGTTAVKVAAFDRELNPLCSARRNVGTAHPRAGWVEQDPEEVLSAVVEAVAEVLDDAPGPISACGLDHQGESVLAWDADTGRALTPIIVWQDKRSAEVLSGLREAGDAEEIAERSGLPLDPYFSAGKLAWLLENDRPVRDSAAQGRLRAGTVDSFLVDRLGGRFATDLSTASRTQLYRLGERDWDDWLLERFSIPKELLPPLGRSFGELGRLRHPSWRQELPLNAQVCDQQAALAGNGCAAAGQVKATYGTGVFVLAHVGDRIPQSEQGLLPTVAWADDERIEFALDGGVFSAGSLLEWLCRELAIADSPRELGELAATVPDAAGVRILPALAGLGSPWWNEQARGVLAGLDGGTKPAHIARAALEAIAWRVADIVEEVRGEVEIESLRVDGGLTNEALLMQLQAEAIGAPVEVGSAEATVTGAAGLAAVGAGLLRSPTDIADLVSAVERVEPSKSSAWREDARRQWRQFVNAAGGLA